MYVMESSRECEDLVQVPINVFQLLFKRNKANTTKLDGQNKQGSN